MSDRSPAVAMLLAAGGVAGLCALDAVVKHLQLRHAVLLVVFLRYAAGSVIAAGVWAVGGRPRFTHAMVRGHLTRGAFIAVTAFLFYFSLTVLTLAEAVTLSFTAPLQIPLMARVMLGERLRRQNIVAGLIGFIGVLVAVAGGGHGVFGSFAGRELGLAAILASSVTYALTAVLMRARSGDGSTLLTLSGAVIPMLLLAPALAWLPAGSWTGALADRIAWPYFIATGVFGNIGIQLLSRAYGRAEAQVLAPVEFIALPWAALFGWLFFAESVRAEVWLGGFVIIAAGVWASRPPKPASPGPALNEPMPPRWVAP